MGKSSSRTEAQKQQKRLRARARRAEGDRKEAILQQRIKPVREWDIEELARGKPRGPDGYFRGPKPQWVTLEVHEAAMAEFKKRAAADARSLVPLALDTIKDLLTSREVDERGRPVVPKGVQADVAKWAVEHLLGKAVQKHEIDVGSKLQNLLAASLAVPERLNSGLKDGLVPALEVESWVVGEDGEVEDED